MLICIQGQIGLRKFKQSFPERNKSHYLSSQQLPMIINYIFRCQRGHLKSVLNNIPFIEIECSSAYGIFCRIALSFLRQQNLVIKVSREEPRPLDCKVGARVAHILSKLLEEESLNM